MTYTRLVEIRWSDVDAFRHVHHASYLYFLETARDEWIETLGGTDDAWNWVIRKIEISYESEMTLRDRVATVSVGVERVGTSSLVTREEVRGPEGRLCAAASCVLVRLADDRSGSVPIPDQIRRQLEAS